MTGDERRKIYKIPTRTVTVGKSTLPHLVNMDEECPLCFDVYAVDDVISVLNCHHAEGMCPLCRIPLNKVIKVEKIPSTNLDRTKQARHNESIPLLCLDNNCQNDIDEIVQKGSPDLFNTIKIELPSKNSNEPYRL
ncbi:hypothetical protein HZS_4610 [Henneguya salminicola]|nr:hypothetical protein HZS_4610 [Henneguya salminicola]